MDNELFLTPQSRARLSMARQVLLYLDPSSLFRDASVGPRMVREQALSHNRAMRWMLVPYLRRWLVIAATLLLSIAPVDAISAWKAMFLVVLAASSMGFSVALAMCTLIAAVYLLLGSSR
jgi:hypothetical protein